MTSAQDHGRVFAVEYDLSGSHRLPCFSNCKRLDVLNGTVGVTASPSYLRLNGKPVVSLWGLGFVGGGNHIADPKLAVTIIQWFHDVPCQGHGGTPSGWGL